MRTLRKTAMTGPRQAKADNDPLAEGLIPLDTRGRRDWASMSDGGLIDFAKRFVEDRAISGRKELKKANRGLYKALSKRELLDAVGLVEKLRDWDPISDEGLAGFARIFIEASGIHGRKELAKADSGLYQALRKRKLLDSVGLGKKLRDWASMSDEQLAAHAKTFIEENMVGGRKELEKADRGLYSALGRRELLGAVGLGDRNAEDRNWQSMSGEELVLHAKRFIGKRGISRRKKLVEADDGLYQALRKRKLLDAVFSSKDSGRHTDDLKEIIDSVREFGGSE